MSYENGVASFSLDARVTHQGGSKMRNWNLYMRHRLKVVCKHVKDTFSSVPYQMRTWSSRKVRGEDTRDFHGDYWFLIRYELGIVWKLLVVDPFGGMRKWCGHKLMDAASRIAGTLNVSSWRGYALPVRFIAAHLIFSPASDKFEIHFSPTSGHKCDMTLDRVERKLVQLRNASYVLKEAACIYDTFHEHLNGRVSEVVKMVVYNLVVVRLYTLSESSGMHYAVDYMGEHDESFRESYEWIKEVRNTVIAHVDTEIGQKNKRKKDVMNTIGLFWNYAEEYEDVVVPVYTDNFMRENEAYRFIGSMALADRTVKAVDRIMRKPIRNSDQQYEIQLVDLAIWMEQTWQNMIAMEYKGSKMIYRK